MTDLLESSIEAVFRELREGLSKAEPQIIPPEPVAEAPDGKADQEALAIARKTYDVDEARRRAETQSVIEGNLDRKINRRLRWKYARWVFCYLVCYSAVVATLLLMVGFKANSFTLPESVMDFLVGSTAAAAIGLVYAVTNGLFGGSKPGG